ncbi:heterokaryon incompatibility protein HET-C [Filobasidium floriforme]|uniref:heterokaryon incompatibility protein HET-C n=1 Tax=Filobasidium floriforme TaxID=5210 RepID=UPI001E8D8B6D|nr:heterokaryon incompatibility protein HET-C [Filobasidium floriforme]KAH8080941.1 heterokaryon incompatibility protein HET-C [Filobasidium floriforme]
MPSTTFLVLLSVLAILAHAQPAVAFGAGNIPSYAYLEGKAFRHGDIEDVLEKLAKTAGGGFMAALGGTKKFGGLDIKRVYFGNWLRDYSQAVDKAGLQKLPLQTIINVVMVLGFLAHGYATAEFEVTKERLGVYLPTEHIDNPKDYADNEDARKYDPRLRGPVDPRELEVDPRTGMKNYIANENGSWDTSKSLVRRVLTACIQAGREARSTGNNDALYEAYRLMGSALHTLEDFTAHSNWCELALQSMGHREVFAHVGRNVTVHAPNGQNVPILVTGTFGGNDFIHSLLGEAGDHLSSASVSELNTKVASARSASGNDDVLRQLFTSLPGSAGGQLSREMSDVQNIRSGPGAMDPEMMTPQQLHDTLWKVLSFRDSVSKTIENTLEKIPGLGSLVEKISSSISVFVFTTLEPYMKPIIKSATTGLAQGSAEVISSHDQLEVFHDPNASDPTHSFLSKDHFNLILNEPAGQIAQVIVEYAVERIVKAWDDTSMDPRQSTEDILQCLFHPYFHNSQSEIQRLMLERMRQWFQAQGRNQGEIIKRLSMDSVQNHKNTRIGSTDTAHNHSHGMLPEGGLQGFVAQQNMHVPGASVLNAGQDIMGGKMPWQQGFGTGTAGGATAWRGMDNEGVAPPIQTSGYHGQQQSYSAPSYEDGNGGSGGYNAPPVQHSSYQAPQPSYGAPSYDNSDSGDYRRHSQGFAGGAPSYGQPAPQQHAGYGGQSGGHGYGGGDAYNSGGQGGYGGDDYNSRPAQQSYNAPSYGGGGDDDSGYPGARRHHQPGGHHGGTDSYGAPAYGGGSQPGGYGGGPPGGYGGGYDQGPPPPPGPPPHQGGYDPNQQGYGGAPQYGGGAPTYGGGYGGGY